jgi:hypothetical protein
LPSWNSASSSPSIDVAIDDAQPGRARLGDLAQELLEEASLDVGGDAAPARQPLLDVMARRIRSEPAGRRVVQRRWSGRHVLRQRIEQRLGPIGI